MPRCCRVARCGADRAGDPRGRPRDRHQHHADGLGARYRPDTAHHPGPDRARNDSGGLAQFTGGPGRATADSGARKLLPARCGPRRSRTTGPRTPGSWSGRKAGLIGPIRPSSWTESCGRSIRNRVFGLIAGERIKVLAAEVIDCAGRPGLILDEYLTVSCGEQAFQPRLLQRLAAPHGNGSLLARLPRFRLAHRLNVTNCARATASVHLAPALSAGIKPLFCPA